MAGRREYDIAFVGLKPGIHTFSYDITDKFFESFQQQDFHHCSVQIKVMLDKKSSFMQLTFEIGGQLEVACDRCNSNITLPLWDDFQVTVKIADEPEKLNEEEGDPDVYYISRGESHLNLENWIYEFINLSIPMHKTCGYENADGPQCNREAIEKLKNLDVSQSKTETSNPVWKGLERFKNLE